MNSASQDTIPCAPPSAPTPLQCTVCLGAGFGAAPCALHVGGCDCAGFDSRDAPCEHCDGTGEEPCVVCDAFGRPAVEVLDGEPLCADCVRLTRADEAQHRREVRLTIHLEAKRRIDRDLWMRLDQNVRWNLLCRGVVTTDEGDGTPIISDAVSAQLVLDLIKSLAASPARRTA